MNNDYTNKIEEAYGLISQANKDMISLWIDNTFLSWQWWVGVCFTIIPWVLWFRFRKKESTNRLLYAAFSVILVASWLDVLGILFGLWSYYNNVVPFSPAFIPWDFTLLPIAVMLLLQAKPRINPLIKAVAISLFSSFVVEPFFVKIGFYHLKHWKYIYSVPLIFIIYLGSDWFSKRGHFERLDKKQT